MNSTNHRLTEKEISLIRSLKSSGLSLKYIAAKVGCSRSTVSIYTRDLFDDPQRIYKTREEFIQSRGKLASTKGACSDCGKLVKITSERCKKCYQKFRIITDKKSIKVCKDCGARLLKDKEQCLRCSESNLLDKENLKKALIYSDDHSKSRYTKLCPDCNKPIQYSSIRCKPCSLKIRASKLEKEKEAHKLELIQDRMPKQIFHVCIDSPTGTHHWLLDNLNNGICKYCNESKSFRDDHVLSYIT